jgi:hypothetical protein
LFFEVYDTENLKTVYVGANQMVTKAMGGILGDAVSFDPSLVDDWWSSELATVPAESIYATSTPDPSPYATDIFGVGGDLFNRP